MSQTLPSRRPRSRTGHADDDHRVEVDALHYLARFDYLSVVDRTADDLDVDPDVISTAVAEFQAMAAVPATGVLDEATLAAMARPRCGMTDGIQVQAGVEAFVATGTRWPGAIVTYSHVNDSPDLAANVQRRIIRSAFDRWSAVVPLVFREVPANQAANIRIAFRSGDHTDGNPFDGPGNVLAHAFFPPPPDVGGIAGDVHFDDGETWATSVGGSTIDLLTVAVHEIGHAIGLRHSAVPSSTMNPFYPTPATPAADDRTGIKTVYAENVWIASIYRDLLGRRHDDGGLDGWVRARISGATPQGIVQGFSYSEEYSKAAATNLYFTLLDRAPDAGGLAMWTNALRGGTSLQAVMLGFLTSAEYLARNPVPVAYVDSLYRRLLNRAPDAGGFAAWVQQMNNGATPRQVAGGFLHSPEYATNLVTGHYRRFLRRNPDQGGLQDWVNRVTTGLAIQELGVGFLASPEYRASSLTWW